MGSTFHGLETARRGMYTQQSALHTTGHNIANANTPGYSRQRVNFEQTEPYPPASMNRPNIPGQIGTGVQAGSVQRIREGFLDIQYRGENNKLGYYEARADALQKMEEIMNEPSENGLSKTLDRFWQSLQDSAVNPMNAGARSVVRQRGIAVTETFNYLSNSLKSIQNDFKNQLDITVKEVNSLANQINNINKQIADVEPHGYLPNDLYDERDRLIDKLSSLVNIKVSPMQSGGKPNPMAEGQLKVEIIDKAGNGIGTLVDSLKGTVNELAINPKDGLVESISLGTNQQIELDQFNSFGKVRSLIDSYGYIDSSGNEKGLYPEMLHNLDVMAYDFAQEFNRVHEAGWTISAINKQEHEAATFFDFTKTVDFDKKDAATLLKVSDNILNSIDNIAASGNYNGLVIKGTYNGQVNGSAYENVKVEIQYDKNNDEYLYRVLDLNSSDQAYPTTTDSWEIAADQDALKTQLEDLLGGMTFDTSLFSSNLKHEESWQFDLKNGKPFNATLGDGGNAIALADVKAKQLNIDGNTTTFQNFYEGVIGRMAVNAQEAERLKSNSDTLRLSVDERRQSVSAVSLDEEMTNMIQFQHAYNAAARMISLTDELLDKIINGMGIGGR